MPAESSPSTFCVLPRSSRRSRAGEKVCEGNVPCLRRFSASVSSDGTFWPFFYPYYARKIGQRNKAGGGVRCRPSTCPLWLRRSFMTSPIHTPRGFSFGISFGPFPSHGDIFVTNSMSSQGELAARDANKITCISLCG